jgi:acetylornithine deacetylase/succinyl-diaminopimelate desuccinylase-like protein
LSLEPRDREELNELLTGTLAIPSPAGSELTLAEWIAEWLADRHPDLEAVVDRFAPGRANLECWVKGPGPGGAGPGGPGGPDLLLYSHLDTSLSGDPVIDRPLGVFGPGPATTAPSVAPRQGDTISGPGVVVAKGPLAAATCGLARAARTLAAQGRTPRAVLLLASGGTHRAAPYWLQLSPGTPGAGAGDGIRRFLSRHQPGAAVMAKAGPPGLLYEEPGAAFVLVEVQGTVGLVMARSAEVQDGGVPAAAGAAVRGVEQWREHFLRRPTPPGSQSGREAGVGALQAGLPYKPDLIGGLLQCFVYLVLASGDDPEALATEIAAAVAASLSDDGRHDLSVRATVVDAVTSQRTDPAAPIVRIAADAYQAVRGSPPPRPMGWTGSTDGVILRRAGVDTVRVGPSPLSSGVGQEALSLEDLATSTAVYAEIITRFATREPSPPG